LFHLSTELEMGHECGDVFNDNVFKMQPNLSKNSYS